MRWVAALLIVTACAIPGPLAPGTPPEAGMWSICYDDRGRPELHEFRSEDHSCDDPVRVHHGSLPVPVHLNPGVDPDVVLRAFAAWEEWVGQPVFELVPESGPGVVEAAVDREVLLAVCGPWAAACAPHLYDGENFDFLVVFEPAYASRVDVWAHELGHVLGLAHDRLDKRSIMYPGMGWYLPRLNPYDRRLLQSLYGY